MDQSHFIISAPASLAVVLASALLLGTPLLAHSPPARDADLLDQARRVGEVAAQKLEVGVRASLRDVERLTSSDPAKALQRLQLLLRQLEDDTALSEPRRETLKRVVKDRIQVTSAVAEEATRQSNERADKQAKT